MGFSLTSTAFAPGAAIPTKHSCDGANVSPSLAWSGVPGGTGAFALIADDPDAPAGAWVHWLLYDLPGSATGLPEAVPPIEAPPSLGGAVQGRNDFRRLGYGGPCPPQGRAHHYVFKLFALAAALHLKPGATRRDLELAMHGQVVGTAELMGTYARQK
jgi:Raf kinase inhibitor-like YbhB/YbcL family protein